MPKYRSIGESISNILLRRPAGENVFRRAADKIFCTACNTTLVVRKSSLDLHLKTRVHKDSVNRHMKQTQIRDSFGRPNEDAATDIGLELVEAFLAANIPLNKLSNPLLKAFLDTHLPCKTVGITTMRRKYIGQLYDKILSTVRDRLRGNHRSFVYLPILNWEIRLKKQQILIFNCFCLLLISLGKKLWVSVDETTDAEGRHVAAVLLRTMEESSSRPYLMQILELDKTNADTVFHAVDDFLRLLGDAVNRNDILALVTDAAAYMICAGNKLKAIYSRMLHLTCLAHALNRLSERI